MAGAWQSSLTAGTSAEGEACDVSTGSVPPDVGAPPVGVAAVPEPVGAGVASPPPQAVSTSIAAMATTPGRRTSMFPSAKVPGGRPAGAGQAAVDIAAVVEMA
jgi:hypothetical protein